MGGAVVNLTGPAQPRVIGVAFPGIPECTWEFGILQRTLRDEYARATLGDIAAGRTTRWLLASIPLMQGGAEAGIMDPWKQVALTEPDGQVRATLAAFALLFAELAGQAEPWKQALEGWDMRSSQVVEEWRNEGQLEASRTSLLRLLRKKFRSVPEDLVRRIQTMTDVARLQAAQEQVLDIQTMDQLQL